jgi:hypothetical protein
MVVTGLQEVTVESGLLHYPKRARLAGNVDNGRL